MTQTVLYPSDGVRPLGPEPTIFLAGSIEQGKARDWQAEAIEYYGRHVPAAALYNPRRPNWDSTIIQSIDNAEFSKQVNFELDAIDRCDCVLMWLEPDTLSPISLLELGLLAGEVALGSLNRLVVGCPAGFWRRGNVEIVTNRAKIPLVSTFEELLETSVEIALRNVERRTSFRQSVTLR